MRIGVFLPAARFPGQNAGLVTVVLRGRERIYRPDIERLRTVPGRWLDRFAQPVGTQNRSLPSRSSSSTP